MNSDYISRALCFHGQPMQKIWEDERGAGDLQKWGVSPYSNFSIYQERQRHFTFQDRAKRLKLHQFFSRKANDLYDKELVAMLPIIRIDDKKEEENEDKIAGAKPTVAVMPPYEVFVNKNQDKTKRWRCVLEAIKPGDIIYGIITKMNAMTLMVKPLCTAEPLIRYLNDIPIKAYIQPANMVTPPLDKLGEARNLATNDYVCCEVLTISVDAERLNLGLKGLFPKNKDVKLGLISRKELPAYFGKINEKSWYKYEDNLLNSKEILNPNYDTLFEMNGLNVNDTFTLMSGLKYPFKHEEYARELRLIQASKWAFRAVAEGIEHFKVGNQVEAFQCLNKALNIDPHNVEGLVARGALYANKGSFVKAVEDFEKALKFNAYHGNARKYMGETLVALGRSYEEENNIKGAAKAYRDCLNIIPNHEQARLSLEAIQQSSGQMSDLLNVSGASHATKEKKKKRNSSHSSATADSSSDSNESNSDSDSTDTQHDKQDASLSPLSKRMALHAASLEAERNRFQQAYYSGYSYSEQVVAVPKNPNEFKLDDDDTESRVKKLLQDASRHKKDKVKKLKKKTSKKSKKVSRKQDTSAEILNKINFEEAYKVISGLNSENKLSDNLQIYEKTIAEIKKRQEVLKQSISNASSKIMRQTRKHSETPPPPPKIGQNNYPTTSKSVRNFGFNNNASASTSSVAAAAATKAALPKLSFQIKKPAKMYNFNVDYVTQLSRQKSTSASPRRRSRTHSRSRSRSHYKKVKRDSAHRRSRSRSGYDQSRRSRSMSTRRRRRTNSRSRSFSGSHSRFRHNSGRRSRSRGRRNSYGRRRTPSPFVPRGTPPRRRRSISRGANGHRYSPKRSGTAKHTNFSNRVWQRPGYEPPTLANSSAKSQNSSADARWPHDKFDDGPSIEEIDEIINQAQKERKEEIIKRDKNILKKPAAGTF